MGVGGFGVVCVAVAVVGCGIVVAVVVFLWGGGGFDEEEKCLNFLSLISFLSFLVCVSLRVAFFTEPAIEIFFDRNYQ